MLSRCLTQSKYSANTVRREDGRMLEPICSSSSRGPLEEEGAQTLPPPSSTSSFKTNHRCHL